MPLWKVELIPEASLDFNSLDGSVRKAVLKQLVKLEHDPRYGDLLGNKAGINLEGYYKLYADKKKVRIVYTVEGQTVRVIAIDRREDMAVYQIALGRIKCQCSSHEPNDETIKALKESRQGAGLKVYSSSTDLFDELDKE